MTTRSRTVRIALVALIAVAIAACSAQAETPEETSPPADATVIAVSAIDFGYTLSESSGAAGTYTFELTNDGAMGHNVVLEGVSGAGTDIIGPGETSSFTVTLEPGEYTLFCSVGNHRAQGMEITFTVT